MSSRYAAGTTDVRIREWRRSRNLVFCDCARMRARPAGPADRPSSTISLVVGRRRRPDGLWTGQADSYVAWRLTRANAPRPVITAPSHPLRDPSRGDQGTPGGPIQGSCRCQKITLDRTEGRSELHLGIARRRRPWGLIGLGVAGTLHPAAFGRCPRPSGNTIRPDRRRRQGSFVPGATPARWDGPRAPGGRGAPP